VGVIDRLAKRAQKRVGGLPYVDEGDRFVAITLWLVVWGFAILFFGSIIYLAGSWIGLWHAPPLGPALRPAHGRLPGLSRGVVFAPSRGGRGNDGPPGRVLIGA
jgi:hypothetical protein